MNYFKGVLLAQHENRWQDALVLVREGAKKDCDMCCWLLGECYWYGVWVKHKNTTRAEQWLKKAVSLGNYRARFLLQDWDGIKKEDILDDYAKGFYVMHQRTTRDACHFVFKSAEQGDCFAQCRLGMLKDQGLFNHESDWFEKSAQQGYFHGQYYFALQLNKARRFTEALYWYRRSAEQGYCYAQYELALLLISRNEAASLYWFNRLTKHYTLKGLANEELDKHRIIFDKIRLCRSSCFALIIIRKYYQSILSIIPKDVVILFAKYLWETREEHVWIKPKRTKK
jgi:TPR repeat protein